MLKGIGASQGYGIGNAVVISDAKLDYITLNLQRLKMKRKDFKKQLILY